MSQIKGQTQKCGKCDKTVYPLEMIIACDKPWHKQCFRCTHCDNVISLKGFATIDGNPYCKPHYLELFKSKGNYKVFSGDSNVSSSYNASAGFKGIDKLSGSDSPKGSSNSSPAGSKVTPSSPKASGDNSEKVHEQIKTGSKLVHTETVDKSAPVIDPEVKVKKVDRTGLLSEVEAPHELKHTDVNDKSSPAIPSALKTGDQKGLLEEVEKEGSSHLKHVEDIKDKSAPVIENVKVKKIDRKEILKEVEQPHNLRDVDDFVRDRSAPVIDPEAKVKKTDDRPKMMEQITKGPEKPLKTPDAQTDRSSPKIPGAASSSKCATCGKTVYELEMLRACDKVYHKGCFRCKKCDGVISLKGFAMIDGDPYCKPHYLEIFKSKGNYATFAGANENTSSSYNASKGFKGY
jgi:hypothetical protein